MIIDAHLMLSLIYREIKLVEIMQIFHRMLLNISPVTASAPKRMHRLVLTLILGRRQGLSVELANRAIC